MGERRRHDPGADWCWLEDGKPGSGAIDAWRAAVGLPRQLVLGAWLALVVGPLP